MEMLMLHRPAMKAPFSGTWVHMLLLPFEEHRTPRSPSSASAALPQLSYLSLPWSHTCVKTSYRPRLPPGTSSGCLTAKKNVLFFQANCTLVLPKKSSQETAPSCWLLYLSFFPPLFLQIRNLLCLREPTDWLSVISSFWEQLDWSRLNAKAAPAPLSWALAMLVAPAHPSSSSLHCLNILCCCCPGCHHE